MADTARHRFGGGVEDFVFTVGAGNTAVLLGGAEIKGYTGKTGGTQHVDLTLNADGTGAVTAITSQDGTGGTSLGAYGPFYGPVGVRWMWLSANNGPRFLAVANDIPEELALVVEQLAALDTAFGTHLSGTNPHGTGLVDLADVEADAPTDGQLLSWSQTLARWVPVTVGGLGGTVLLAGSQVITGTKTFNTGDPSTSRVVVSATSSQTADLLQVFSAANQSVGGVAQKALAFDALGRLRLLSPSTASVPAQIRAAAGQSANLFEQLNSSGTAVAWMDSLARWRAPNLGHTFAWSLSGDAVAGTGTHRFYNDTGVDLQLRSVRASVGTAPTGSGLTVDVNVNGSSVFTNQANRPTIAASGTTSGRITSMDVTNFAAGAYLTIDVDAIGSTVAGKDLVVQVTAY